jgi:hypothetical protein
LDLRARRLNRHAIQIVLVGILDEHGHDVALRQMRGVAQMDLAVYLRRVGLAAAGGAASGSTASMITSIVPPSFAAEMAAVFSMKRA